MADATQPSSPAATQSLHGDFLEHASPRWLIDALPARRQALKDATTSPPTWLEKASPAQREAVAASFLESFSAQTQLDKTMASFQDVNDFARPLLLKALKDQYQVEVDVDKTLLCLRRPLAIGVLQTEISDFQFLKLSMLDAALHNFEADECKEGAYHKTSGFVEATDTPGTYHSVTVNLKVSQFLSLCRSLDIGVKYQAYLQTFFYPEEGQAQATLREHFIASQKAALKAAAEQAVLTGDILPADQRMILSVIEGEIHPWMGNKQVWFRTLGLMKLRMTGCMVFLICKKYTYPNELIIYIPQDPVHPLKRYTWAQMEAQFKRLFTERDAAKPADATPTPYQAFFSRFVPYEKRAYYFSQFTQKAADSPTDIWRSPWKKLLDFTTPHFITGIKELPPEKPAKLEPNNDPYLSPSTRTRAGKGIWAANIDPWKYFYEQHREQLITDARAHAVPAADVDAKAREAKLAHLLEIGMLGLNMASMFVPVLGEVMMTVMAGQLLYETLEGAVEWGEGDLQAAKAHLIDVAENLAQIAVMAGVGAGVSRWRAAKAQPVIEALNEVKLPDGRTRLWRASLERYASPVTLEPTLSPNDLGQYTKEGKTYIRLGAQAYEQSFDTSLQQWRIKHPTDPQAYQPLLEHNGHGAWQHTLERPLEWDRLTLLRRIGHATEAFTDQALLTLADVSGVSDNTLRKMHVERTPAPPELLEAMRLFNTDTAAAAVIEQLEGAKPIDELYLYALPLIVEMPRWPQGRALEIIDGPALTAKPVRYGVGRSRTGATIKVSRQHILGGELPERILEALDESERVQLLGAEAARVREARKLEFNKQLADHARQRKPAIFDSIYAGTEAVDPRVRRLQRNCPGLSDSAAQAVLEHASADELASFETAPRVPLNMLEEARWYARQGRLVRAYAGLRREAIATADSRRLALNTLETLPGWPSTLRLEVRDGRIDGALLDSIGPQAASAKKYLVKQGPGYQAFDERGEALNSLPRNGDNFFASLMHALPDDARQSLGVPQVSQQAALQAKIIAQADKHRLQAAVWLEPKTQWFKAPARVNGVLKGYYASGRMPDPRQAIIREVRKIYPDLTDAQVDDFILELRQAGNDVRAIANRLRALFEENRQMQATLDGWISRAAPADRHYHLLAAQALKRSWRQAVLAGKVPGAQVLSLNLDTPLPPLTANFSHVRELNVSGAALHDGNIDEFLRYFPKLESLSIEATQGLRAERVPRPLLTNLPVSLARLEGLKHLRLTLRTSELAEQFPARLATLTGLERLEVGYFGYQSARLDSLDLTPLQQLKTLRVVAPNVTLQWPAYVHQLAQLERLDLAQTRVLKLPDSLYTGYERLWRGLSLDWSQLSYEAFKPAYEHVKNYAGSSGPHLMNLDEMVKGFAQGELALLMGEKTVAERVTDALMSTWKTPQTRMNALQALREEHLGIFKQFYQPSTLPGIRHKFRVERWEAGYNARILTALEKSWTWAVSKRYGVKLDEEISGQGDTFDGSVFELPAFDLPTAAELSSEKIDELPVLPAGTFSHVKTLKLSWLEDVPADQLKGFVRAFGGVEQLEVRYSYLSDVPVAADVLPSLTHLNLSDNLIVVTPAVQAQFDGMKNLQVLNLQYNPLGGLNVSAMTKLTALNLRDTRLQAWPTGAENLAQLACLDMRDNALTSLAPSALSHPDMLLRTELAGNPLSAEGEAALNRARNRIERERGLPQGALSRFALAQEPWTFPPTETAASLSRYLLFWRQMPENPEETASFVVRLRRVNAGLNDEQGAARIEQLRQAGMSDTQLDTLLSQWQRTFEVLTRTLNGWVFSREIRVADGDTIAFTRTRAAESIRLSWQQGVTAGHTGEAGDTLSLKGLKTGDLPALNMAFEHVRTLDLTGVRLTAQGSNEFLGAFTRANRLILSANQLSVLPDAVAGMAQLERLELATNLFTQAPTLPTQVGAERLRWLDMSHNDLETFDASAFSRLETLDLSYNSLSTWPEGVLAASHLTHLDLSGNVLANLPPSLLSGAHDALVAGTDLSGNHTLTPAAREALYRYADRHQLTELMGLPRAELDRWHRRFEAGADTDSDASSDTDSSSDSDPDGDGGAGVEPVEALPEPQLAVAPASLEPWLEGSNPRQIAQRTALWEQLAQAPGHDRFFWLMSSLRLTSEFNFNRAGLTQRVWDVIEVATTNAELRSLLFVEAETHGTCIDGRILTFSQMEVRVFEHRALHGIPLQRPDLRGRALLDLSRQLFRLDRVDQLAEASATGLDRAEERLRYRIGLTHGWPDGLELPGQPEYMAFGRPIEGTRRAQIQASIIVQEDSDEFIEYLVAQDHWARYLQERYPEQFDALNKELAQKYEALEDEHAERADAQSLRRYEEALNRLEVERATARNLKLMQLSRMEIQRLASIR
ncbi:NEL-type E3 ubiquitin ligase domain-containing protein [Pseudomonas lactis]|uniref:RING-type E3 ubiquitin transferase n=3 Tax=Pseudomonas lactis TaxID=1615674 RepID=I4K993_9PSED|nr:NEL-type E3 ubiquitin ligase domain-containing protein [Pseudomonas lactis]EIK61283.1 leucine-rich repeat domain protein [Pseudomonas lactis]